MASALFWIASVSFAYETDNFTHRAEMMKMPDATIFVDTEVRTRLVEEVHTFNQKSIRCEDDLNRPEPLIIDHLESAIAGPWDFTTNVWNFSSGLERYLTLDSSFEKYRLITNTNDSIYKDWTFIDDFFGIQPAMRLDRFMIGLDKIGHFFHDGLAYFRKALALQRLKNIPFGMQSIDHFSEHDIQTAIRHGQTDEYNFNGNWTSGVFSYADLNANFQGFRFWLRLLKGTDPYLSCINGKYKINPHTLFTFKDYVHAGWDEAQNCSELEGGKDHWITSTRQRIQALGGCPINRFECEQIAKLPCAEMNVSPRCLALAPYVNPTCMVSSEDILLPASEQIRRNGPPAQKLSQEEINKIKNWLKTLR